MTQHDTLMNETVRPVPEQPQGEPRQALPPHWRLARLGDVANISLGRTPARDNRQYWEPGTVPWVAIADLDGGELTQTRELISRTAHNEVFRGQLVPLGTILFSFKLTIGKVAILGIPAVHNEAIASLHLTDTNVSRDFLIYELQTLDYSVYLDTYVKGRTLNKDKIKSLVITLPPLPEQRAIAHVLRTVQDAIAARRRELELERERKAALMQHLFTHGTRGEPTKMTEIGEIPESWRVMRLGEVATIERGRFMHRPRNDPAYYGGNIPFIQTGDVTSSDGRICTYSQTLNELGLSVSRIFPAGTIVITIAANIGYTGILQFDSAFPDSLIGITPTSGLDAEYLNYYLTTQQSDMDRLAPRGTQKNINIEFLSPWPVVVSPLAEQHVIAESLRTCDVKVSVLAVEVTLLDELFRSLSEELMTGRLSAMSLIETSDTATVLTPDAEVPA
jgi:type I restriction enzyme, S subunit